MNISVGEKVPEFELFDQNEKLISSDALLGQKYILFFYPKDDTPTCTKVACSIRDEFTKIRKRGYKVFGVSPDNLKRHKNFILKFDFQYPLLSDPDKIMLKKFGLWGPKKFMGREIIGVYRTTFIINEQGLIEKIIHKVKTKVHGEQILSELEEISINSPQE